MVIYLPLLFADGQPTSLERISPSQLAKFIPFMLQCCPEKPTGPPDWWPPSVPFQFPLLPSSSKEWINQLKQLVTRCYEYHQSEHVLRFCARLAEMPSQLLKYKESSHPGFVSIYNKTNNKLIVTFKKKNQVYDKPSCNTSPFKKLLIKKPITPAPQHIEDIYLCNYCDEEFCNAKDAIAHEAACKGEEEVQGGSDQVSVMKMLGLVPCDNSAPAGPHGHKRGTSVRLTARSYMPIPISSPLGLKMGLNVSPMKDIDKMESLEKVGAFCSSSKTHVDVSRKYRKPRQPFKSYRKKQLDQWTHSYCFNKSQRAERRLTLKTGLNKRARALLKTCKAACVLVERLPLLDPLAIHAAARLQGNFSEPSNRKPNLEQVVIPQSSAALCIDLTIDSDSDNSDSCGSFLSSSSDHVRPTVNEWRQFTVAPQCVMKC